MAGYGLQLDFQDDVASGVTAVGLLASVRACWQ